MSDSKEDKKEQIQKYIQQVSEDIAFIVLVIIRVTADQKVDRIWRSLEKLTTVF